MKRGLSLLLIFWVLIIGVIGGIWLDRRGGVGPLRLTPRHGAEVDTVRYFDTVPYYKPVAKGEVSLGTRIRLVPVLIGEAEASDLEVKLQHGTEDEETLRLTPRHGAEGSWSFGRGEAVDSVAVEIPITQREYEGEEYHAWVSGYEARLDSIFVFPRREEIRIRECSADRALNHNGRIKRWGIGVFAGYGMTPQGMQPCVGVSINYNLWMF